MLVNYFDNHAHAVFNVQYCYRYAKLRKNKRLRTI